MTVANRAIGAPINIWNDHSDSMSQRDCGWVQLYAEDNQAAVDLHVVAFRLAEQLNVPVMVCVDGFVLTHATEPIDVPDAAFVDRFLPPRHARQLLDPDEPVAIGAMVGPDTFTEVRYLTDRASLRSAQAAFGLFAQQYSEGTGHPLGTLARTAPRRAHDRARARLGDSARSGRGRHRRRRRDGRTDDVPAVPVRRGARGTRAAPMRVIVLERAFAPGSGGIVSADVRAPSPAPPTGISTVVAGLGGRPITGVPCTGCSRAPATSSSSTFLDLDYDRRQSSERSSSADRLGRREHPP